MIKSDLVQKLADANPSLVHADASRIVNTIFDTVTAALSRGDRVELRGFGMFFPKQRTARVARNPRTGAPVKVEEKRTPHFRLGKDLRRQLNAQ